MVYTNLVDASRTHFILFSPNYNDDLSFVGTKINIKTYIPREIATDSNYYQFGNKVFNEDDFGSELFKNRVIFSTKINDDSKRSITLLTQQNLFHNIKFIQKDNDFNKPRILFIKYNITSWYIFLYFSNVKLLYRYL